MLNGPRVVIKMGMASGTVSKKMPNKTTGRADYYGRFQQAATHCHTAAPCRTATYALPHCHTLPSALPHTAIHCYTLPHALRAHYRWHCHILPHTATHCRTLPHSRTAAQCHAHCHTLPDTLMFNGPRVKAGMAPGTVSKKMPNKTTGADYFGRF
jgi:hypothetical protein